MKEFFSLKMLDQTFIKKFLLLSVLPGTGTKKLFSLKMLVRTGIKEFL